MHQFILKTSVLLLLLLGNAALFGMKCTYNGTLSISKKDRIKSLPKEMKQHIVDSCDDPIPFGKTTKENYALVKKLGLDNLRQAYRENNPDFVLNHYVPILPICSTPSISGKLHTFRIISAYNKAFYCSTDSNITPELSDKIIVLGDKRLNQLKDQKRNLHIHISDNSLLTLNGDASGLSSPYANNSSLALAVVMGNKAVIKDILNKSKNASRDVCGYSNGNLDALRVCITNQNINNEALELIFKDPKTLYVNQENDIVERGSGYYRLLMVSRQLENKKAFEILVTEDIHNTKNVQWGMERHDYEPKTALDYMIEDSNNQDNYFSVQDIAFMRKHGAKTAQELQDQSEQSSNEESLNNENCIIS